MTQRVAPSASLRGHYILESVCSLAAAAGSAETEGGPEGTLRHPGTSCLADAAPVVGTMEAYARTRALARRGTPGSAGRV